MLGCGRFKVSDLVDPARIEEIVGVPRHERIHFGRAVSKEQTVYILHSQRCVNNTPVLRDCIYSLALDKGIDLNHWEKYQDRPVVLRIWNGSLEVSP
jgi:hypothetical protein